MLTLYDKILDMTKMKAYAENELNVAKVMIYPFDRVEDTAGKGKMLITSIFSFPHSVFKRLVL